MYESLSSNLFQGWPVAEKRIMVNHMLSFRDNYQMNIRIDEIVSAIPTFPTKQAAICAGREFGWRSAVQIERRFEKVWVVGKQCFQDDNVAGLRFDSWRFPLLKWVNENGTTICPVLTVRRFKQGRAA
ncbi:hypothetical protein [Klebsiella pneumoniae]|uniref:hypothetical protein n=1 Tax=Klebsiella pneumoniae TaxID=573 RepID=UPI0037550B9C